MPIRPEHRWFYPIDWQQLSAVICFQRAKGRCERCGRPHGRDVLHLADGHWFDEERQQRPMIGVGEHAVCPIRLAPGRASYGSKTWRVSLRRCDRRASSSRPPI